jgi:hypothetical protein
MTNRTLFALAFVAPLLAAACSGSAVTINGNTSPDGGTGDAGSGPRDEDYDQSCTTAFDCVAVYEGSNCCAVCPTGAVNKKDQARFETARAAATSQCSGVACPAIACDAPPVVCNAGRCALDARRPPILASQYSRDCTTHDDCVAVAEVQSCAFGCPSASINKRDLASYQAAYQARLAECSDAGTIAMPGCIATRPACENNTCVTERCPASGCARDAGTD